MAFSGLYCIVSYRPYVGVKDISFREVYAACQINLIFRAGEKEYVQSVIYKNFQAGMHGY
nr:MAG TPA: hypothetical protein [Caudoviricetes sp.]